MFRHAMYNLRGGFLIRPLTIALALGCAGAFLSWLEEEFPAASARVPTVLFPSHADPQVAQVILAGIAASMMTVVSIVFAILLMTLTLASMQFSPRIIVSFSRDRVTQWTLGLLLARRPAGRPGHSGGHRRLHDDSGVHRVRHPADDAHPGIDAVLPAHHRQLFQGPRDAMDARYLPRHLLVLHGGAAGGALAASPLRASGYRAGRDGAGAGLRRLAALFHSPHLAGHQCQSHRRQNCGRNGSNDR